MKVSDDRIQEYANKCSKDIRCDCKFELSFELRDHAHKDTEVTVFIDNIKSHQDDCACLPLIASDLEGILYQDRIDKYIFPFYIFHDRFGFSGICLDCYTLVVKDADTYRECYELCQEHQRDWKC